jgi:hypothetical protein
MILIVFGAAVAGEIFYYNDSVGSVEKLDTRLLNSVEVGRIQMYTYGSGMAYDAAGNTIWASGGGGLRPSLLLSVDLQTLAVTNHLFQLPPMGGMAYHQTNMQLVGFSGGGPYGAYALPGDLYISDPGMQFSAADWYNDGGYIVAIDSLNGAFYRYEPGLAAIFLASAPPELLPPPVWGGLAYDMDTKLFFYFDRGAFSTWLIDSESFTVVGQTNDDPFGRDGGAGSIDTVPQQTPELLVTGTCPGTVYVTVVDATPGSAVYIASAGRLGARTISSGPCAGTSTGLRSPAPRSLLTANSVGIASARFEAPVAACGTTLVQAVDEATCMVTSVRTVPDTPFTP